ncbi:MAG: ABC transporter ATP-binding protein/permease [Oscillospiraceae bacterium]|nr:ABC transporter ATP-binding protein/permease [Oscillospiraceae bacterium]
MADKEIKTNKKEKSKVIPVLKYFFPDAWRKSKTYFILSVINVLLTAAAPMSDLIFMPLLVDSLIAPEKDIRLICLYGGLMITVSIILNASYSALTTHLEKYADFFYNATAVDISSRCMEIDFALTENKEALEQIKKARDGMDYSGGVHNIARAFFNTISNALKIFGAAAIMIASAPLLLIPVGVLLAVSAVINKKKNEIDVKQFSELSGINRIFGHILWEMEDYRGGKDVRLYSAGGMMIEKASQQINRLNAYWEKIYRKKFPYNILDAVTAAARDFGTYLYLGILAIIGKITIGTFTQLVNASGTLGNALQGVIFGLQEVEKASGYAYEVVKFMEYPPYMEKGDKRIENLDKGHTIEFKNVSFSYPNTGVKVLDNVSITLHSGEKLSVVGLNGAGKTTFIKLLCRLYDTDSGEILLDGVNIKSYDYDEYMKLFAVVFQDFRLLAFSVDDNVLLGNTEPSEVMESLLEKVGLDEKVQTLPKGRETMMFKMFDKEGVELSGGEQQKLAIARALYKDAPVVILDEPTAALDPVAEYEIYKRFDELVGGKTAVYISHRLSSCKFCDHIAVFSEGTIKEFGTHDELLRKQDGLYSEMFKAQAQYYI